MTQDMVDKTGPFEIDRGLECKLEPARLLSIKSAAARGIKRLRMPKWACRFDHIQIDVLDGGKPGPWTHFFSPMNSAMNKRDPVNTIYLYMDYEAEDYDAFQGPLPDSEEYKAEVLYFNKVLAE